MYHSIILSVSFYQYTGVWLQPVADKLAHLASFVSDLSADSIMINTAINDVYSDTVNVLCNATDLFVPQRKKNFINFCGPKN